MGLKNDQETYAESLANFQKVVREFRDAIIETAPEVIKKFFRWLEDHNAWLFIIIGLVLLPFIAAIASLF